MLRSRAILRRLRRSTMESTNKRAERAPTYAISLLPFALVTLWAIVAMVDARTRERYDPVDASADADASRAADRADGL